MKPQQSGKLFDLAKDCLMCCDVTQKLGLTRQTVELWVNDSLALTGVSDVIEIADAGRPDRPELVATHQLPARKLAQAKGHAAFIHALAHIEFNAINLAWDAVYRFRDMPREFYDDWVRIAHEEASHFQLLENYLAEHDYHYGDFPAHNNLWQMAVDTAHDPLMRMALVPRVLEARGLDVTPGMIDRLQQQGHQQAAEILQIIYRDEIGHVESGTRWFRFLCQREQVRPDDYFQQLIDNHAKERIRAPLNQQARKRAGFSEDELNYLHSLL